MSYGGRLTLFVVLIVLVPTVALLGILLTVSEESRSGKADARELTGRDYVLEAGGQGSDPKRASEQNRAERARLVAGREAVAETGRGAAPPADSAGIT